MIGAPATLYFNHAGTSWPKPAPVQRAVREALEAPAGGWAEAFDRQQRRVAAALGIDDPQRLLLTPGCTSALQVGLRDHPWVPGDRLLTSAWEHQALLRPALELRARGVEHGVIGPGAGGERIDLEELEAALRRGRVRMVALCAATNVTGALLPVAEVCRLAHAYGALVLVDAAQTAGWLDIDVAELDADLVTFAGHKGPQAPWGIGGLYVAAQVTMSSPRLTEPAAMVGYCDTGSVDRLALAGLVAGLEWLAEPARADRLARARAVIARIAAVARELPEVTVHGPTDAAARMPTLALSWGRRPASDVAEALGRRGVIVSGGRQCAPLAHATLGTAEAGVVRLSAGPQTTLAEADLVCEALASFTAERGD